MRTVHFLVLAMLATAPIHSKPSLPDELVLSGDNLIDVVIEGKAFRLEVRPEAAEAPMLNPAVAAALQLKPGMFGFGARIGPELVSGASAVHRVDYGEGLQKQRIFWANRAASSVADGVISPASLPYKRVRFTLGTPALGEALRRLPLDNFGMLGRIGVGTTVELNARKAQIQFSLERDENLVSAPTGNWLAENRGGKLYGTPRSTVIVYGIERPTRAMALDEPFRVAGLAVSAVDVRVSDYGDATRIRDDSAAADTNEEIVVTGKKERKVDPQITVGRNFFKGCSSLLYDLDKREIAISCLPT